MGWQIMIGLALGIICGLIFYQNKSAITVMQSLGTIFIRLIQMIVMPIVVSCLTVGIANIGDIKKLGRIGGKTWDKRHSLWPLYSRYPQFNLYSCRDRSDFIGKILPTYYYRERHLEHTACRSWRLGGPIVE